MWGWFKRRSATKADLIEMEKRIIMNQKEILAQVKAQSETLTKIGNETDILIQKVADLEAALANQPEVTPELAAAVQAVSDQLKIVDDKVPDAVPTDVPANPDA